MVHVKMKTGRWIVLGVFLALFAVPSAHAKPCWATTNGNSCMTLCHTTVSSGRMSIVNEHVTVDLGVQLDGAIKGPLKTFVVAPGQKVTLSMSVLDGTNKYSVQLKNMEKGGQLVNTANTLIWSPANIAQNVWVKQQETNPPTPPYFTKEAATCKGISWGGAAVTYTFDLQVDALTPPDLYNLTFAVAGQNDDWYQEIDFYVEVLCPYKLAGDANGDCKVDLADLALMAENWLIDCVASPTQPACVPR